MKKIIAMIHPFDLLQTVLVFQNGEKIDMQQIKLTDLEMDIFNIVDKHQAYQIDLAGPRTYIENFKTKIEQKANVLKYTDNKAITINII